MQTEWYHRSHDSQLTQLIKTLSRELIWHLATEQGFSSSLSISPSRSTWLWCWLNILLMVRCLVSRRRFFGGSLLPTRTAVSIQTFQTSKFLFTHQTFEIRLFVSRFSTAMEHLEMSFLLCFGLEFVTVAHGTFFKSVCYYGWLAFITVFLTISLSSSRWRNVSKWPSRNVPKTDAGSRKSNIARWSRSSLDCHSVQQDQSLQRMNTTSFEWRSKWRNMLLHSFFKSLYWCRFLNGALKKSFTVEKLPHFKLSSHRWWLLFWPDGISIELCVLPAMSKIEYWSRLQKDFSDHTVVYYHPPTLDWKQHLLINLTRVTKHVR